MPKTLKSLGQRAAHDGAMNLDQQNVEDRRFFNNYLYQFHHTQANRHLETNCLRDVQVTYIVAFIYCYFCLLFQGTTTCR